MKGKCNLSRFEALYYPYFEPEKHWLRSSLLFFDKVRTIIPRDASYSPSQYVLETVDYLPDAYDMYSPTQEDIQIEGINFERLEKGFQNIEIHSPAKHNLTIDRMGNISIEGYSFIHEKKLSDKIKSILIDKELIDGEMSALVEKDDFYVIKKEAGDLIVSTIADKLALRHGWDSVTDRETEFTVNARGTVFLFNVNDYKASDSTGGC